MDTAQTTTEMLRARRREVLAKHEAVDHLLAGLRRLAERETHTPLIDNPAVTDQITQAIRDVERAQEADLQTADALLAQEAAAAEHEEEVRKWKLRKEHGVDDGDEPPPPPFAWMTGEAS